MKKEATVMLLALLLLSSCAGEVSASKTIFLTSDNIIGHNDDIDMLNSIKNYIEEYSNGAYTVIVDSEAPGPGEGTRAIESSADIKVNLAAADAANLKLLAKYAAATGKQVIFVNTGDFDLDEANSLRRAWDDNYSPSSFAGINSPGEFLNHAGITYIQPLKEYPDAGPKGYLTDYDEDVNKYIAEKIVESADNDHSGYLDESLIITHDLPPEVMAESSQALVESSDKQMEDTYNTFTAPQILYMTSSYLNGNGLQIPEDYGQPTDPLEYSVFAKGSYKISDYMKMAGIAKQFMDENGRAPNYIEYDGARISYYDLVYNFAKITQGHTDGSNMDFQREYTFDKVNESILISILPYVLVIVVVIILCKVFKRIRRK